MKTSLKIGSIAFAAFLLSASTFAQTPNPGVASAHVLQNPITTPDGIGISFKLLNIGGAASASPASTITVGLLQLAPNPSFTTADITSPSFYTWVYLPAPDNMFVGTLTGTMPSTFPPASPSEWTITFNNLVSTATSPAGSPANGFNVNVVAPPVINSLSSDDNVSNYVSSSAVFTPLATKLASFTVKNTDCNASLDWVSVNEESTNYYVVETSIDGKSFKEVGRIDAAVVNSDLKHAYHFNYSMNENTPYFFRLKMVDQDNSFEYSNVERASCKMNGAAIITASPNPASSEVKINGLNNGSYTISVIDVTGRQLTNFTTTEASSSTINLSKYPAGIYNLRVEDASGNITNLKVSKQ